MANVILLLLLGAAMIFGIRSYAGKLAHGCCGGESGVSEKRVRVRDREVSHYPHAVRLSIAGMTCRHCALRVENALNGLDGVFAKVDLGSASALVRMKTPVPLDALKRVVAQAGYSVTGSEAS